MKRVGIAKSGWNAFALIFGPFWYLYKGIVRKGSLLLIIVLITLGIGLIPVWLYCGSKGNHDFYKHIKEKGLYIY